MSKKISTNNNTLSISLRKNLQLRKKQTTDRDANKVTGKILSAETLPPNLLYMPSFLLPVLPERQLSSLLLVFDIKDIPKAFSCVATS